MREPVNILLILLLLVSTSDAQHTKNPPGLNVIKTPDKYKRTILLDSNKTMSDLTTINGIIISLVYATANNFLGKKLYTENPRTTYLRKPAAEALSKVVEELKFMGLTLKILDAYRPYSATVKMWKPVRDERYVANPAKGSGHNRGISIDLTLVTTDKLQELDMGTGFDNFSDTAHHSFKNLPDSVLANRIILKTMMEKHGFNALESEWWHYSFNIPVKYELLNLSFKQLEKISKRALHRR